MSGRFKATIITLHRAHPEWDTRRMAAEIGCHPNTVRTMRFQCGLPIPHALNGRPRKLRLPPALHLWNFLSGLLSAGA